MKRLVKGFIVVMMCFVLSMGIGVPAGTTNNSNSTVITVQAKQSIRKSVKKAANSYYKFYKSYVKFMKKYLSGNISMNMLSDYEKLMKKAKKVDKAFNNLKNKNLNTAELQYWLKIYNKVLKLLGSMY